MTYYHSFLLQNFSLLLWWQCRISAVYEERPTFSTLRVQVLPTDTQPHSNLGNERQSNMMNKKHMNGINITAC
jgi:hypothetical protein